MKSQGKVRWIAISTTLPHLPTYLDWGVFDQFQIPYSALQREHEEWITKSAEAGIGTVIRGGVAQGSPERGAEGKIPGESSTRPSSMTYEARARAAARSSYVSLWPIRMSTPSSPARRTRRICERTSTQCSRAPCPRTPTRRRNAASTLWTESLTRKGEKKISTLFTHPPTHPPALDVSFWGFPPDPRPFDELRTGFVMRRVCADGSPLCTPHYSSAR